MQYKDVCVHIMDISTDEFPLAKTMYSIFRVHRYQMNFSKRITYIIKQFIQKAYKTLCHLKTVPQPMKRHHLFNSPVLAKNVFCVIYGKFVLLLLYINHYSIQRFISLKPAIYMIVTYVQISYRWFNNFIIIFHSLDWGGFPIF